MNLSLVFNSGDPVLISVFVFLILMSVATWILIIFRTIKLVQAKKANKRAAEAIWASESLAAAEAHAKQFPAPVSDLTLDVIAASKRFVEISRLNTSLPKNAYYERELRHSSTKIMNGFDSGLTVLASVGATAPFIGLFGTVWGIYHALENISKSGQMSIAAVAGPIGEALVATAFGLFVAIPAVLAYNFIVRGNKTLGRELHNFAHDLHVQMINSKE